MLDFFRNLLDTSDFPARWNCGNWTAGHGWVHIVADLITFGAYFAIPICIVVYKRRRPDVTFPVLFYLFGAFILSCGLVHLIEAGIFWVPVYRLSAVFKVMTAVVSIGTVIALVRLLPKALDIPGVATLNSQLQKENAARALVEEELRARNEDLDEFAYIASHDLKSPLRGIQSLAQWIAEDAGEALPPQSMQHLEKLQGRALRMQRLLEDLLLYSRAGRDTESEELDLGALCAGVVELTVQEGSARVQWHALPTIWAPRAPLELVFRNLIGNAIKHHDGEIPDIQIRGHLEAGFAVIEFADDGPGIEPEYEERIFALFQTLRPRDEVEGSGMGLAVVRKALNALGGSIRLLSKEGRGATFRVQLPVRQATREEGGLANAEQCLETAREGERAV